MEFNSLYELKMRVMPALRKREADLKYIGYNISIDDIWTDLSVNRWSKCDDLTLNEIVNDILKYLPNIK